MNSWSLCSSSSPTPISLFKIVPTRQHWKLMEGLAEVSEQPHLVCASGPWGKLPLRCRRQTRRSLNIVQCTIIIKNSRKHSVTILMIIYYNHYHQHTGWFFHWQKNDHPVYHHKQAARSQWACRGRPVETLQLYQLQANRSGNEVVDIEDDSDENSDAINGTTG